MIKYIFAALILFTLIIVILRYLNQENYKNAMSTNINSKNQINYIAVGDSYTIGFEVSENDRWPNILTSHLVDSGIKIKLVSNPSVSGYTVRDAIEFELRVVQEKKPDFVTVLIGTNDNFTLKDVNEFGNDLAELLDKLESILTNPKNIVLITIPDYSKSPAAKDLQYYVSQLIQQYNNVIKNEAGKRGLKVADIFPISQTMISPQDYTVDGIHPSAVGYAKWEKVIFPVVFDLLSQN